MNKKLTTEEYIARCFKIHGEKYFYSKVVYKGALEKIEIICKRHGSFLQIASEHLRGRGCHNCGRQTLITQEFIEKAKRIRKINEYDYSRTEYINCYTKVEIVCKVHGVFQQEPRCHLKGQGCPQCGDKTSTKEEFIEKSVALYENKFDYSKAIYDNNKTKVEIICPEHGSFFQKPNDHLMGHGCSGCSGNKRLTTEEFLKRAKFIHGNAYDYSKTSVEGNYSKVDIVCPKHGSFWQTPKNHIYAKHGCPKCSNIVSKMETEWLDKLDIIKRQATIRINRNRFIVDGYNPVTNTIYEFLGDYFHGNPKVYSKNESNQLVKKTFGELYTETMHRINLFKIHGFNVVYIWESDFKTKAIDDNLNF